MRKSIYRQLTLTPQPIHHEHCREMAEIAAILDENPELEELVEHDLLHNGVSRDLGRDGMTADQVLRTLVVKQMNQFSYEELAFHVADSATYRAFCRFGVFEAVPKKSALQDNIRRVSATTMEAMNQVLVRAAQKDGIDNGRKARIDSTAVRSNVHEPSDSSLLWDVVRVLVRYMSAASEQVEFTWSNHSKRAKRRTVAIISARKTRRETLYCDLLDVTRRTVGYAENALQELDGAGLRQLPCALQLAHYLPLAHRVIDQAHRRIVEGHQVPVDEKLLSIFEPETDLIVRGRRDPTYGHKICLSIGASSLVYDCEIERGNPTDSTTAVRMVERTKKVLNKTPEQVAFDGGFSSKDNVASIKSLGVTDVAFTKHLGLEISDMVRSSWVFKRLRRFRAGVEGCISFLKRCFGLARCTWKGGRDSFSAYVWSSILSANLLTMARHRLA
jgi:IS5 family transposase